MAVEIIKGTEVKSVTESGVKVVNVFGTWCGPCKMFAPVLEDISNNIPVYKIDVDQNNEFAREMKVQGVPTTFIYKDGKVVDTIVGFQPKELLEQKISEQR